MPVVFSGDLVRVLLVSSSAAARSQVGEALAGAGELRYYWISQPGLALVRAQNLSPHAIIVDDELGEAEPAGIVRDLVIAVPGSVVVALVRQDSLDAARTMVLAGARAIVTKPVQADLLLSTLRQTLGRRTYDSSTAASLSATGRMVVVCGSKGGTGRTTLAINTAVGMVDVARETVVMIDADYGAPALDVALNLQHQRDIMDLLPKLSTLDADLMDNVLATHSSGVRVLLAPNRDVRGAPPTVEQIEQIVSSLRRMYAWVLVDLGLPIDDAAYAYLDQADVIIMSVLPEMVALRNAQVMLRHFDERRYQRARIWPTVNREGIGGSVPTGEIAAYLGRDVRWTIPNDQELATETINRGVPMVISHRRRPLAQRYRALARELVKDRSSNATPVAAEVPELVEESELSAQSPVSLRSAAAPGASEAPVSPASRQDILIAPAPESAAPGTGRATNSGATDLPKVTRRGGSVKPRAAASAPGWPRVEKAVLRLLAAVGGISLLGGLIYGILKAIGS